MSTKYTMPKANQCDCCKDIYINSALKSVHIIGDFYLMLCPDCFKAFNDKYIERGGVTTNGCN